MIKRSASQKQEEPKDHPQKLHLVERQRTRPQAMAIPMEGYFALEQGRYGQSGRWPWAWSILRNSQTGQPFKGTHCRCQVRSPS